MQVHFGTDTLDPEWPRSVLCIGTFDGVHLGHQRLISTAVEEARRLDVPCILATFDRNPAAILAPEKCPPSLAPLQTNLREFCRLGVAVAVVLSFDKPLSETTAEDFFQGTILSKLKAGTVVVGHDFTFGKGRVGNPDWLRARIETIEIDPILLDGERVSSSGIRKAVETGDIQRANRLLGRPFEITGIVVGGQRLGRTLGYPTLNLARSFRQVVPADGIYAGDCTTAHGRFKAAISVGIRPMIDSARTIEAYLLDYPGAEIYGVAVELRIHERLREQRRFEDLESLKMQICSDVEEVSRVIRL